MGRGLRAIIVGLTVAAAVVLSVWPAESTPGETGGRALGSRIAAGIAGNHVCAVKEDGTVRCWGSNSSGQLGNNTGGSGQFSAAPVTVSDLTDAVAVAAGAAHSCALRATGSVVCWGSNDRGRLGDGTTTTPRLTPVPVVNPNGSTLLGVVAIAAGSDHTCAVRVDGTARCWGAKRFSQLGTGAAVGTPPIFESRAATVVGLTDAGWIGAGAGPPWALRSSGAVSVRGST